MPLKNISSSAINLSWNGRSVDLKPDQEILLSSIGVSEKEEKAVEARFLSKFKSSIIFTEKLDEKSPIGEQPSQQKPKRKKGE